MSGTENWKIGNEIGGGRLASTRKVAFALNAKDAEIGRLRAALQCIVDEQNSDRYTVTPETAFEDFGKLNRKVCAIYDRARAALGH